MSGQQKVLQRSWVYGMPNVSVLRLSTEIGSLQSFERCRQPIETDESTLGVAIGSYRKCLRLFVWFNAVFALIKDDLGCWYDNNGSLEVSALAEGQPLSLFPFEENVSICSVNEQITDRQEQYINKATNESWFGRCSMVFAHGSSISIAQWQTLLYSQSNWNRICRRVGGLFLA